jgi:hypothetical protein
MLFPVKTYEQLNCFHRKLYGKILISRHQKRMEIMDIQQLKQLAVELAEQPEECEWIEFKLNNSNPQEIGEYLSALSNSACCRKKDYAYPVYGLQYGQTACF